MAYEARKWIGLLEEIEHDGGPRADPPLVKVVSAAIIANPLAGGYTEDLAPLVEMSPVLGAELARRAVELLGGHSAEGYGKGAIAGAGAEQEHAVACITTPFGNALRDAIGGGAAWISSSTKVGAPGEPLDIPLAYKDAVYVRSHYDTITLRVPDAPRQGELLVAVALSTRGRVHERLGGQCAGEAVDGTPA